jgi:hypothetical protein
MSRPCDCGGCRLCWLYENDPAYRGFWDDQPRPDPAESHRRNLACVHLGEVLDKKGCACPGLWVRHCPHFGAITLDTCKTCPTYETLE